MKHNLISTFVIVFFGCVIANAIITDDAQFETKRQVVVRMSECLLDSYTRNKKEIEGGVKTVNWIEPSKIHSNISEYCCNELKKDHQTPISLTDGQLFRLQGKLMKAITNFGYSKAYADGFPSDTNERKKRNVHDEEVKAENFAFIERTFVPIVKQCAADVVSAKPKLL